MPRREALQISRAASGKMRTCDPELVKQVSEAGLDRAVLLGLSGGCYGLPLVFTE
jgi:hypothetical protein